MIDYIDLVQPDDTPLVELSTISENVPTRVIIEYELSSKLKDISKKVENDPKEDLPR